MPVVLVWFGSLGRWIRDVVFGSLWVCVYVLGYVCTYILNTCRLSGLHVY